MTIQLAVTDKDNFTRCREIKAGETLALYGDEIKIEFIGAPFSKVKSPWAVPSRTKHVKCKTELFEKSGAI